MTQSTWHFYDLASGLFSGASFIGTAQQLAAQLAHKGDGVGAHDGEVDYLSMRVHLDTGALIDHKPEPPWDGTDLALYVWAWDSTTKRWYLRPRLKKAKADKWAEVKAARDRAIDAPLTTAHGMFDHDEKARMAIAAKAQFCAANGSGVIYSLADNTPVALTALQMNELWRASHTREQGARSHAAALRVAIDAAGNAAAVDALGWGEAVPPPAA